MISFGPEIKKYAKQKVQYSTDKDERSFSRQTEDHRKKRRNLDYQINS